jgi:hypothetical protein
MRLAPYILATFMVASPAAAQQGWKTYTFSAYSFSVAFPADPKSEITTYHAPDGRTVEARVYSVSGANSILRMTVVELSGAPVEDTSAIEHAVAGLTQGSEIKLDIPHHIGAVLGRQLSSGRGSFFRCDFLSEVAAVPNRGNRTFRRSKCNGRRHTLPTVDRVPTIPRLRRGGGATGRLTRLHQGLANSVSNQRIMLNSGPLAA